MQDVGNDVTLRRITGETGQGGAEAGAFAASRRAAGVLVRLFTHTEELDAHVGTAVTIRAQAERVALILLAAALVRIDSIRIEARESTAIHTLRVHRSDTVLCPSTCHTSSKYSKHKHIFKYWMWQFPPLHYHMMATFLGIITG